MVLSVMTAKTDRTATPRITRKRFLADHSMICPITAPVARRGPASAPEEGRPQTRLGIEKEVRFRRHALARLDPVEDLGFAVGSNAYSDEARLEATACRIDECNLPDTGVHDGRIGDDDPFVRLHGQIDVDEHVELELESRIGEIESHL